MKLDEHRSHVRFNTWHVVSSLNLMVVVGEWGFLSHFTGAETEAQRKEVTCPQSRLGSGGSQDPDPGLPGSGVCIKTWVLSSPT